MNWMITFKFIEHIKIPKLTLNFNLNIENLNWEKLLVYELHNRWRVQRLLILAWFVVMTEQNCSSIQDLNSYIGRRLNPSIDLSCKKNEVKFLLTSSFN